MQTNPQQPKAIEYVDKAGSVSKDIDAIISDLVCAKYKGAKNIIMESHVDYYQNISVIKLNPTA